MSVATEIARIKANLAAAYAVVGDKGGELPTAQTSANLAAAVGTITTPSADGWVKPDEWPDLHKVIEQYPPTSEYPYAVAYLYIGGRSVTYYNGVGTGIARKSDDPDNTFAQGWYQQSATFDVSKDINGTRWIIKYYKNATDAQVYERESEHRGKVLWVVCSSGTSASVQFLYSPSIQAIEGDELRLQDNALAYCYSLRRLKANKITMTSKQSQSFYRCKGLAYIDCPSFDATAVTTFYQCFEDSGLTFAPNFGSLPSCTNVKEMFYGCDALQSVESLDTSAVTNAENMLGQCGGLKYYPDTLDLSNATSVTNALPSDRSQPITCPTHLSANINISLWTNGGMSSGILNTSSLKIETFAAFDEDGVVNGGMVFNMNEVDSLTLTVNANLKSLFTEDEQSAIEDALTEKGWQISW